jgi:beta-lactamase regulating signal transducer with metallopeptidase domain
MNQFHDLVGSWSGWMIHSGWQSAIVVALVAVLLRLARRSSAQFRYAILLLALLKFAVPPFTNLSVGLFSQSHLPLDDTFTVEIETPAVLNENNDAVGQPATASVGQPSSSSVSIAPAMAGSKIEADMKDRIAAAVEPNLNWLMMTLFWGYTAGVLVATAFLFHQHRMLRRLVKNSVPASANIVQLATLAAGRLNMWKLPPVLISASCDSPFATGLLRQIIVLPKSVPELPTDQIQIILGHELVHIRRRDLLVGWFETVLSVLWWFHPGMWWLKRALRSTREDCCDDIILTSRLAVPERYCETLIHAAAQQTFRPLEPMALGFSNGEHPAARRIRRLMDSSLFRTHRLSKFAVLLVAMLALFLLPGLRAERAPIVETSLEGLFGWRNLPFDPVADELAILKECHQFVIDYRSTYSKDGKTIRRFDDLKTRDGLEDLLKRNPDFFYTQHLLGTWYRRNGDLKRAQELLSASLKNAPVVLTQRYRTGNGDSLSGVTLESMSIECNRVKDHSIDQSLELEFIDLVTNSDGEVAVPVYDTVFRIGSRTYPAGYDTEMQRLGFFSAKSRIGVLPEITAWKSDTQPSDFTRTAAESALLENANGTTTNEVQSGSNVFSIGRVARCQTDGQFTERITANSSSLASLPTVKNAAYMDHAIIDLASPAADRFEIRSAKVLDSKTKIPLSSFQVVAGATVVDQSRFHLYSLHDKLPDEIDLVLSVSNFEADAFRMQIPAESAGTFEQNGVKFVIEYLGAGQHVGWSSDTGFYKDARAPDWISEMLCHIETPNNWRLSLIMVTKDGQRIPLDQIGPFVRIPKPLSEIAHFELIPRVESETIYFEKISLPVRTDALSRELPVALFQLSGIPETTSSDVFNPLILRCKTRQGDVYEGSVAAGEFGIELYEKPKEEWNPDSMSTITIEAYIPGKIDLSPTFYSRADSAEVKWANSSGMTSGKGSVKSTIVSTRLDNIGTVAVSLKIKESTD